MMQEFIQLEMQTQMVTINLSVPRIIEETIEDLGKILSLAYIQKQEQQHIGPCDEGEECHIMVLEDHIFKYSIPVRSSEILYHGEYAFLALE